MGTDPDCPIHDRSQPILRKKAYIPKVDQTFAESYRIGLKAVRLGIMLALSGISVTLVQFAIKTFIVRMGGLNDVGLYEAGWALNTTYLGLVLPPWQKITIRDCLKSPVTMPR